ncbi:MAG: hypothetical protein WAT93_00845 [Pontixanthobacter sp.]
MSNSDVAEAIGKMSSDQQANLKKSLIGLIFKCFAGLALIGVIAVFFTMQNFESERDRYVNEGAVSKALVLETSTDDYKLSNSHGKTVDASMNFVRIVHDPKSPVKYGDLGKTVQEADLPVPQTGEGTGNIVMEDPEFSAVKAGDILTVVSTPYEPSTPWTLQKVRDYSPNDYYLWMGVFGALAIALWFIARMFSRR